MSITTYSYITYVVEPACYSSHPSKNSILSCIYKQMVLYMGKLINKKHCYSTEIPLVEHFEYVKYNRHISALSFLVSKKVLFLVPIPFLTTVLHALLRKSLILSTLALWGSCRDC